MSGFSSFLPLLLLLGNGHAEMEYFDNAPITDFMDCPHCTDPGGDYDYYAEHQYQDASSLAPECLGDNIATPECVAYRVACLSNCTLEHAQFLTAVDEVVEDFGRQPVKRRMLSARLGRNLTHLEDTPPVRALMADCVTDLGVEPQWTVKPIDRADNVSVAYCQRHRHDARKLLLGAGPTHCRLAWVSSAHGSHFFGTCLQRMDIDSVRKRAAVTVRDLQALAFDLRAFEDDQASTRVGAGAAQIGGGILGGIGIILAPVSAGASLTLTIAGGATAAGGALTTLFGTSSPDQYIADAKKEMELLEADIDRINKLLLLFTHKNHDYEVLERSRRYRKNVNHLKGLISSTFVSLYPAALNGAHLLHTMDVPRALKRAITAGDSTAVEGGKVTRLAASRAGTQQGFLKVSRSASRVFKAFTPKGAFAVSSMAIAKARGNVAAWRTTALARQLKLVATGSRAAMAQAAFFPVLNVGFGIWDVVAGMKQFDSGFAHQVKIAARRLAYATDTTILAYEDIVGEGSVDTGDVGVKILWSLDVHFTEGTWDAFSGAILEIQSGTGMPSCRTKSFTPSAGETVVVYKELGDCLRYKIYNDTSKIWLVSDQNSLLRDRVALDRAFLATDGNHVPSLTCSPPSNVSEISASHGRKSAHALTCKSKPSLMKLKTHTSHTTYSGTDNSIRMELRVKTTLIGGEYNIETCVTDYLDNWGNDREYGDTDVYRGYQLGNCTDLFRDTSDFGPVDNVDYTLIVSNGVNWGSGSWHVDLIKLYLVGRHGQTNTLRCNLAKVPGWGHGTWINSNQRKAFDCSLHRPLHPGKSLEKLEVHTCNIAFAGTGSDRLKIRMCNRKEDIKKYNGLENGDCCTTNFFGDGQFVRDSNSYIDGNTRHDDGGEELGECEGMTFSGSSAYLAFYNYREDKGCFDQMLMYGSETDSGGSVWHTPFASCQFPKTEFDSGQVRIGYKGSWHNWLDRPARCDIVQGVTTVKKVALKVCESTDEVADPGTEGNVKLVVENGDGDNCTTTGLRGATLGDGDYAEFTNLGWECARLRVTDDLKVWVVNVGEEADDALCLTDVYLDASDSEGKGRVLRCRYDQDRSLKTWIQGAEVKGIPLVCL